jgi:serine/threonine protein kinase
MRPGDVVGGRFAVIAPAGMGGMGVVYRARDLARGGEVALKVPPETLREAEVERLIREAEVLEGLDHPGIVRYVSHGVDGGRPWVAEEWLHGELLSARLAREPLSLRDAVLTVARAADALGDAHRRGVVHRDVKPANLFLVDRLPERVKVIDFGAARRAEEPRRLTRTGMALGTPGYMAPEQALAEPLDARCDVFALGCVLYECLSGEPAFASPHPLALQAQVIDSHPPDVRVHAPHVPAALADLVDRLLVKQRAFRLPDGRHVAEELASLGPLPDDPAPRLAVADDAPTLPRRAARALACLIVAGPSPGSRPLDRERVAAAAARFGARLTVFEDGSLLADAGDAAEAARLALELRGLVDRAVPLALVSAAVETGAGLAELALAGAALLDDAALAGEVRDVVIDERTARRLAGVRPVAAGRRRLNLLRT